MLQLPPPPPGSTWSHTNGNQYTVLCIANEFTERPEQYPQTVVYQGANGKVWSRPVSEWARSMAQVAEAPAGAGSVVGLPVRALLSDDERAALAQIILEGDE